MKEKNTLILALSILVTALFLSGGTYLFLKGDLGNNIQTEYITQIKYIEKEIEEGGQQNIRRPFSFVVQKDSIVQNNGDSFEIITLENFEEYMPDSEDDRSFHIRLYSNPGELTEEEFSKKIACKDSEEFKNPLANALLTFDSGVIAYFTQEFCGFHYIDRYTFPGKDNGNKYFIVFTAGYRNKDSAVKDEARKFAQSIEVSGIYERKIKTVE